VVEGAPARRKQGDRRVKPRFDIVGELPGTLEMVLNVPLHDISTGGALLHSHVSLPPDSVHRVLVTAGGQDFVMRVKVRHVRETISADSERSFFIGVEFISVDPLLVGQIAQLMQMVAGGAGES